MTKKPTGRRPMTPEQKAALADADYEFGYGKPPKATQFVKGKSGNPSGRPKRARALRTDVLEVLDMEVTVTLPTGPAAMSMQRAMMISLMAKAARGDVRATHTVVRIVELAAPERLNDGAEAVRLDAAEQAIVDRMLATMNLDGLALPPPENADDVDEEDDDLDWDIL